MQQMAHSTHRGLIVMIVYVMMIAIHAQTSRVTVVITSDTHLAWMKTMTSTGKYMCGFCITGHHENCRKDVVYNEIALSCGCACRVGESP